VYTPLIGKNVFEGQLCHLLTNLEGLFAHCVQELFIWNGLCFGGEYNPVREGSRMYVVLVRLVTLTTDETFIHNLNILQVGVDIVYGRSRLDEGGHFGVQGDIISK